MSDRYRVLFTPLAQDHLDAIADRRIRDKIVDRAEGLATDPELQGKPLGDELAGLRSLRAVGQRYRIIYRVRRQEVQVVIVAAGIRKEGHRDDIYRVAERLFRLRLIR